jgi:hypothetical protein
VNVRLVAIGDDEGVFGLRPFRYGAKIVLRRREELSRPILGRQSRRSQQNYGNAAENWAKHGYTSLGWVGGHYRWEKPSGHRRKCLNWPFRNKLLRKSIPIDIEIQVAKPRASGKSLLKRRESCNLATFLLR